MEFQVPAVDLGVIQPFLFVVGTALLIMVLDLFLRERPSARAAPWIALGGLLLALFSAFVQWNDNGSTFSVGNGPPMVIVDNFAVALNVILLITGILTVLIAYNYLQRIGRDAPEFYILLLLSVSGMMLMGMANDLILIFLALELLSIPLYILAGYAWPRPESEESAMKYFLLGAFSSAIFVFGIALVYGATGTTSLPGVLADVGQGNSLLLAGAAMILVGFGFKIASVPFHMWTPDVYEGAPIVVTAFMSVGAKVAGFAALIRILLGALPALGDSWVVAIAIMAALTLIVGNFAAIAQTNVKRMLGYSSIAHAGYILMAVAASYSVPDGMSAALFYMFAYVFTNMGAFAVATAVETHEGQGDRLEDYKGLAKRYPWMAIAMALFMLSLIGIPPTAGFAAKFYVFSVSIEAGLFWLTIIGVLTAVVSAYYYLRVVFYMYMYDGEGEMAVYPPLATAVVIAAVVTVLVGVLPGAWWDLARQAIITSAQALAAGG